MSLAVPTSRKSSKPAAREALERPFARDFEQSELRRAERGVMPKSFDGLLEWFAEAMTLEIPATIHRRGVWAIHQKKVAVDRTGQIHRPPPPTIDRGFCADAIEGRPCSHITVDGPIHPGGGGESVRVQAGGSAIGSPDDGGEFQALIYGSPSQTDEDGSYVRPLHRAIAELHRNGWQLTAGMFFALAAAGYDWRAIAERGHWAEEPFAIYLEAALGELWRKTIPRDERKVRIA